MTPYTVRAFQGWRARSRGRWRSALAFSVLSPLLFLLAMGSGLGTLVRDSAPDSLGGVDYRDFVAPGLLAASAMQLAVGESTWPVMGALRWDRSYHAMLATPLRVVDVFYGHLLNITMRIAMGVLAFAGAAVMVGLRPDPMGLLAVPAAILTGVAFAAPTAAWAIGRKIDSTFSVFYRIVVIPLFLFSATFFPLTDLPTALRVAIVLTPLWHGVDLCRDLALGELVAGETTVHVAYLVVLTAVGLWAGRRTFAKALAT
jgi:lipooligosaccharide transport system permease protein